MKEVFTLKPSIFSKDYNRYIKRRRRIRNFLIIGALILLASFLIFRFGIKNYFEGIIKSSPNSNVSQDGTKEKENEKIPEVKPVEKEIEGKEVRIKEGLVIKIGLIKEGDITKYGSILTEGLTGSYSIAPSGNALVFLDKSTQDLYLVDKDGNSTLITYPKYISSNKTVFEKDKILSSKPDYIWVDSPKFLGEDKIIYLSNVPWFGNPRSLYVWIYDINTKAYKFFNDLKGASITLNGAKEKGFEINVDGNIKYIDNKGGILKN